MFSGAMIEHAAQTMRKAGTNITVPDDDGLSQVCLCHLGSYLKANWDSKIRKPLTQDQEVGSSSLPGRANYINDLGLYGRIILGSE